MARETAFYLRSRHIKDSKNGVDTSLLNTQNYKVRIKGKMKQSREGSSPLPKVYGSSNFCKENLRIALDYGRKSYLDCF